MWLRVLKTIYVVAKATGFDQKVKSWVVRKLQERTNKIIDKADAKLLQVDALLNQVDPLPIGFDSEETEPGTANPVA